MTQKKATISGLGRGALALGALLPPTLAFADSYVDPHGTSVTPAPLLYCIPSATTGNSWTCSPTYSSTQGAVPMTVGATYAPGRSVGVMATQSGDVTFVFPDGSTATITVAVGWQAFLFSVTRISASTATATYYNLK